MTGPEGRGVPLGLEKSVVSLSRYDPSWAVLGEKERTTVQGLLGELATDVQHVGSTAVAGLDAKPILDIAVALAPDRDRATNEIVKRMEASGYEYRGDKGPDGGLLFVRAIGDVRTVHVHMVALDDPEWNRYIRFRDYLRATPQRRDDYQRLKRQLATRHAADRGAYTDAKTAFIVETLRLARDQTTRTDRQ